MIPIRRLDPPLSSATAEALSALHGRAFAGPRGARGWSAAEIAALTAGAGALLLIAGGPDAPVGFALLRAAAGEAELLTIATDPEARRRGAAAALLAEAQAELPARGVEEVFLEVAAGNAAAAALYRKVGFEQIAVRRNYYAFSDGCRDDALIFRLSFL